jgi:UDPglucose 6-dehydrogenase
MKVEILKMKICVIGTGYVGLVIGACFAETGNSVVCADIDEKKIEGLKKGRLPIFEPGLQPLVERNTIKNRLCFTTDIPQAVKGSLICFIAVGTPPDEDGSADLTHVLKCAETIGKSMESYTIIVDKSTVPVGTADKVRQKIALHTDHEFDVVSNPEFLKEGSAVNDFMMPERIILGTDNVRVAEIMKELYSPFVRTGNPILVMDIKSAEITKYAANAMLAVRISFMNEFALLCEKVGANISHVRKGIASDSRIGQKFLFPGVGYGGSCFPKDVKAIIRTAGENGIDFEILGSVENVNKRQKHLLAQKVVSHFGNDLSNHVFALWGLAFKPNTDDMREAPSLVIIEELIKRGARINAYDPAAASEAQRVINAQNIKNCQILNDSYDCLKDASALLIATEWNEFRRPDFERMEMLMKERIIFDGRNIFGSEMMAKKNFTYFSIGNA